jgi:hypothetical protein
MDSNEIIVAAGQAAATMAKDEELLRLFYKDLGQPGVKQVGKALSTVLGLGNTVLLPLKMVNEKANALYTHHMDQFRKKLEQVPEEKIVEAAPEIGVPILENLGKTTNEAISQMYINLLANASHIDLVSQAHPRFVSVIESLTPDEALILNEKIHQVRFISIESHISFMHGGEMQHGVSISVDKATKYHKSDILHLPENASFYFDNMKGLGLFTEHIGSNHFPVLGDPYAELRKSYEAKMVSSGIHNDKRVAVEGYYQTTPFGRLFIKACQYSQETVEKQS